jgi:hypothetical protein
MAHVNFNHLNATAFNSFVPRATKEANGELFKKILIVGGIAFVVWGIYTIATQQKIKEKESEG